jgi:carbon storage regulator
MLVLSRKKGEWFMAGDVKVVVTKVKGSSVTIGVEAPEDIKILRGELKPHEDKDICMD